MPVGQQLSGNGKAFEEFQRKVREAPGVRRFWMSESVAVPQFWILLERAQPQWVENIFQIERELVHDVAPSPVEVFVYGADEVDVALLPEGETLFEPRA